MAAPSLLGPLDAGQWQTRTAAAQAYDAAQGDGDTNRALYQLAPPFR